MPNIGDIISLHHITSYAIASAPLKKDAKKSRSCTRQPHVTKYVDGLLRQL